VAKLSVGHLWGEKALFIGESSLFTITVDSPEATLLLVTRESLRSLFLEHKDLHLEVVKYVDEVVGDLEKRASRARRAQQSAQESESAVGSTHLVESEGSVEQRVQSGANEANSAGEKENQLETEGTVSKVIPRRASATKNVLADKESKSALKELQLRAQEDAAYSGSEEQKKHLLGVSFRSSFELVLLALPVAERFLQDGAKASGALQTEPQSAPQSESAAAAKGEGKSYSRPSSRPASAARAESGGSTAPRSASSRARPASARSASERGSKEGKHGVKRGARHGMESTWSQWTGERQHKVRSAIGPGILLLRSCGL
jgi:hypothetical protein